MRKLLLTTAAVLAMVGSAFAVTTYVYKDGSNNLHNFLSLGGPFPTTEYSAHVLIDSTGTEKATNTNPVKIDPTGTTPQPVTISSPVPVTIGATVRVDPTGTTPQPVTIATLPAVTQSSQYPLNAIPETISATGSTAATTATLAAAGGVTTYVCGFSVRSNATSATQGNVTLGGVITGTMTFFHWVAPLASGIGTTEERFAPCVPASGTNTTIVITAPAAGSGGTTSVAAWGYQK
jgi:hypothetical protein